MNAVRPGRPGRSRLRGFVVSIARKCTKWRSADFRTHGTRPRLAATQGTEEDTT